MNIDEIKWISRFERLSTINNNLDWSDSKFTHEVWCWDNTKRDTHIKFHMFGRDFWWCPEFCPKEKAFYAGDNKPLQYFDIFQYDDIIEHCDHNDHVGREESLKELNKDKEKVINDRNK